MAGENPIVTVVFMALAASAIYLVWPRGQLRVEIRPDAISYDLGQRETFRIQREGVDLVRVIALPGWSKLAIRRQGHRLEMYRSIGLFGPSVVAEALRRAGWPVEEES